MTELSNFDKIKEFHKAFGLPIHDKLEIYNKETLRLRFSLVKEEFNEVKDELFLPNGLLRDPENVNIFKLAKELADLLYVVYGFGVTFGIDLDKTFKAVHDSNMTKLGPDGKPIYREDGKVIKGPNYQPPDMEMTLTDGNKA